LSCLFVSLSLSLFVSLSLPSPPLHAPREGRGKYEPPLTDDRRRNRAPGGGGGPPPPPPPPSLGGSALRFSCAAINPSTKTSCQLARPVVGCRGLLFASGWRTLCPGHLAPLAPLVAGEARKGVRQKCLSSYASDHFSARKKRAM
jgi:hypothetical protein